MDRGTGIVAVGIRSFGVAIAILVAGFAGQADAIAVPVAQFGTDIPAGSPDVATAGFRQGMDDSCRNVRMERRVVFREDFRVEARQSPTIGILQGILHAVPVQVVLVAAVIQVRQSVAVVIHVVAADLGVGLQVVRGTHSLPRFRVAVHGPVQAAPRTAGLARSPDRSIPVHDGGGRVVIGGAIAVVVLVVASFQGPGIDSRIIHVAIHGLGRHQAVGAALTLIQAPGGQAVPGKVPIQVVASCGLAAAVVIDGIPDQELAKATAGALVLESHRCRPGLAIVTVGKFRVRIATSVHRAVGESVTIPVAVLGQGNQECLHLAFVGQVLLNEGAGHHPCARQAMDDHFHQSLELRTRLQLYGEVVRGQIHTDDIESELRVVVGIPGDDNPVGPFALHDPDHQAIGSYVFTGGHGDVKGFIGRRSAAAPRGHKNCHHREKEQAESGATGRGTPGKLR